MAYLNNSTIDLNLSDKPTMNYHFYLKQNGRLPVIAGNAIRFNFLNGSLYIFYVYWNLWFRIQMKLLPNINFYKVHFFTLLFEMEVYELHV